MLSRLFYPRVGEKSRQLLQERLASSAVSHRVTTLHPYNTRQHNKRHKAAQ